MRAVRLILLSVLLLALNVNKVNALDSDLKTLIESSPNDGSITTINIDEDVLLDNAITISNGQNIVLTGDKTIKKVTDAYHSMTFIKVMEGASLTINDLTFDGTDLQISASGSVTRNTGVIENHGALTFNNVTMCNFIMNNSWNGVVFNLGNNASFIFNTGIIKDIEFLDQQQAVVYNAGGSYFELNEGIITDIKSTGTTCVKNASVFVGPYSAPDEVDEIRGDTLFVMNGGKISNHTRVSSEQYKSGSFGGVFVGVDPINLKYYDHKAKMIMNGGIISDNYATGYGGGISVLTTGEVVINDGTIENNTGAFGGGISCYDYYIASGAQAAGFTIRQWEETYKCSAGIELNGGTIRNNTAFATILNGDAGCGGGIYVATNKAYLNKGSITNNEAERQGGGVYVASIPYVLHLQNVLITENYASIIGGGIWSCPTGETELSVTAGGGLFDNTADTAGDDLAVVGNATRDYTTSLSKRMLGGGLYNWYTDGGLDCTYDYLGYGDGSPRYPENSTYIESATNSYSTFVLKSTPSEKAKQLAKQKAVLTITNNSAPRGGGIGSNGDIVIGNQDYTYSMNVEKVWNAEKQDEVEVTLSFDNFPLDTIILNKDNDYKVTLLDIPDLDTVNVSVKEVNTDYSKYEVEYPEVIVDHDNMTIDVKIINNPITTTPYTPPHTHIVVNTGVNN